MPAKAARPRLIRPTNTSVTNPTVLGSAVQFGAPGFLPLASTTNNTLATTLTSDHSFAGSGDTAQSNSLTGDISVTVAEVLPNGDLVVQGEKLLTLTEGHEHIRFLAPYVNPTLRPTTRWSRLGWPTPELSTPVRVVR